MTILRKSTKAFILCALVSLAAAILAAPALAQQQAPVCGSGGPTLPGQFTGQISEPGFLEFSIMNSVYPLDIWWDPGQPSERHLATVYGDTIYLMSPPVGYETGEHFLAFSSQGYAPVCLSLSETTVPQDAYPEQPVAQLPAALPSTGSVLLVPGGVCAGGLAALMWARRRRSPVNNPD